MASQKIGGCKKKRGPSSTRYYAAYKLLNKRLTNKIKKLTAYVSKNPNDKQAAKSLRRIESA